MNDNITERLGLVFLGLIAFAVVVGGIVLAWNDKSLPGELIAIGSAAAGVIGGLFGKIGGGEPRAVNVVNEGPDEAIPVAEAKPAKRTAKKAG